MPNHITNELVAPPHVLDALRSDKSEVDFNQVVQRPEFLGGDIDWDVVQSAKAVMDACSDPIAVDLKTISDDRFEMFVNACQNIRNTDYVYWHDWCCEKWGTKWNAYDIERRDQQTVRFETAWAPPLPVIKALSEKFPDDSITIRWADEDFGNNTGHLVFSEGEIVSDRCPPDQSKESFRLAFDLKYNGKESFRLAFDLKYNGVVPSYYKLQQDGTYKYKPEDSPEVA
jgi:hypothetical protein